MQKKKSIRSLINENVVDLYSSKEFKNLSDVEKSVVISTLKRIKKNDDLGESYQDVFKAFNYMTYDPFYFNNIWPLKDKLYQLSELYWKARKEEEKEDEKLLSDTEREMCKNSPVFKGWLIQAHKEIEKKSKVNPRTAICILKARNTGKTKELTKGDYINKLIELVTQKSRLETYELMCDHISGEDYGFKSANIELHDIEENIADIVQILKRWEGK